MEKFGAKREQIIEMLEHEGGVSEESVRKVSRLSGVPEADIWGAGTFYSLINKPGKRIRVCDGLTCQMFGADRLSRRLQDEGKQVERVICLGQCDRAPATLDENLELSAFGNKTTSVTPDSPDLPMNLGGQDDADYSMLSRAKEIGGDAVINLIRDSELQGRGGAGFPAHVKWESVRSQHSTERYVVCNADESEPGTFKDREVLRRRPHLVLEGLAIAAHVVAATDVFIYLRGEYMSEYRALQHAIEASRPQTGEIEFHVVRGHGAYICGEETALLESLEGRRGMPRLKPPFPTVSGFRGQPTLVHNVETIACVPAILHRGGDWFKGLGRTEAGTKLYCISGHVNRPGVFELPLGVTLDELVEVAGGFEGNPRAFSPGGASSGFLPIKFRDLPLDYKNLSDVGSMLGSSGVVVINDTVDMAQAVAWQLEFFERESCGQCAPCRIGARYLRRQVHKFLEDRQPELLEMADDVSWEMEEGSICGLGMTAFKPLQTVRQYFPEVFGAIKSS